MGLLFRPRRPLLRAATGAATAGIAYRAGRRRAEQDVSDQQAAAAYEAASVGPERAPSPAAVVPTAMPIPAEGPSSDPTVEELARLGQLHDAGTLTDEEFAAAKAKLLGL